MDIASENQAPMRASGLKPPSKIQLPSPSRQHGLSELNESATNARGAMGPPPTGSIKHKPTGCMGPPKALPTKTLTLKVPEPPSKQRKTLADRAVEYPTKTAAPPSNRPVNNAVKATMANGVRNGLASSTSRLPPANTSRHTSQPSFSGSVGQGSRLPGGASRPKSAYGGYGHNRSKSSQHGSRPATSMAQNDDDQRSDLKGAVPILITTNAKAAEHALKVSKRRTNKDRIISDAAMKRMFSQVSTPPSLSLLPSVIPPSEASEAPTETECEDVLNGFRDLSLGSSAAETDPFTRRRNGRGMLSGKDLGVSSQFSTLSNLPRPSPSRPETPTFYSRASHRSRLRPKSPDMFTPFLNRFTNVRAPVFDTDDRLEAMERQFLAFKEKVESDSSQATDLKETIKVLQSRVNELESIRAQLVTLNDELRTDLKDAKSYMSTANLELETTRRNHTFEVDDLRRKHRNEVDDWQDRYRKESDRTRKENEEAAEKVRKDFETQIEKLLKMHSDELAEMKKRLDTDGAEQRNKMSREMQELQTEYALKMKNAGLEADTKEREIQLVRGELSNVKTDLERERLLKNSLQAQLSEATSLNLTLEAANKAVKAKVDFLESDSQAQSQAFNDLHRRMQEAIEAAEVAHEKLRQEETLRRKLHNQVQELKGNIRVMCRVRPTHDTETDPAKIAFPDADTDSKEVAVQGPEKTSALGNVTTQTSHYEFDRVFSPTSQNGEVFEEISQLVQSALDGYNVCIFCYGQTGSGKTFTMSSADGMIPRATAQIYAEATRLEEKGWRYKMEGSFVEVYNETYNDLLGRSEDLDKKKVEVRHDTAKKTTTLENTVSVLLDSPTRVEELLKTADKNRSVAATKANSRSSRSHSVFILKLVGENNITGERSEGTLNLVDLAGSERLEHSKAEGARLKETQNINKSLSCLGDVINALGSSKEGSHIPYRNSKLTYLLQYSLGGNSKTLMFVMVSPLQAHLQETITSLKFATKVHNTHIGTAKKQTKA
ncbi:P-loop containing nucleoside triphosphate hydrolase protein [Lophiotrema nucula]|uniref:P-loop containing nucleoside triphosphate hydrolase protein n=1 Tax=Lophiotrema nucula TaxID=690887 RepID=A0A6A5YLB1_9PLEO|nr:P-loop containing nucleoside triphosphate hydrolase protein [Lophiotrema nucula]